MDRYKLALLFLLIPSVCFAVDPIDFSKSYARMGVHFVGAGAAASVAGHCDGPTTDGAGNTILLCEDYDGSSSCATTYTSTCQNTWTATVQSGATVDFDNAATPAPLQGTYSLRITSPADHTSSTGTKKTFTASNDAYAYFKINFDSIGDSAVRCFAGFYNSTTSLCAACLNATNKWAVYMNDLQSAATGPSADTLYHIWFEYQKGGGGDAKCRLYVSTDTTKPSVTAQKTTGTTTAQSDGIDVSTKEGMDIVLDWVRVNTSAYAAGEPD